MSRLDVCSMCVQNISAVYVVVLILSKFDFHCDPGFGPD